MGTWDRNSIRISKTAAVLVREYNVPVDQAFLGAWYLVYSSPPTMSFAKMKSSVTRCKNNLPTITERQKTLILQAAQLGPNPWPLHKDDLTYCRRCYRYKIRYRLLCYSCYMSGPRGPRPPRLCLVPGCTNRHCAAGRCRKHYQAAYRSGTLWQPPETQANLPVLHIPPLR